jgi:hypothetical protein
MVTISFQKYIHFTFILIKLCVFVRLSYKEYLSSPSDGCDPILINPWLAKIISIVTENIPVNVHNVEIVRTLLMKW